MGAWILASFLLFHCSFILCSYEIEETTDDEVTESVLVPNVKHKQSTDRDEQHEKSFKPSKMLYTLVAKSSQQREFQTVGADDTAEVIYNDVLPLSPDSYDANAEVNVDNQELNTPEGRYKSEDQHPSGSYQYDPSLLSEASATYHLKDNSKSPKQKEVHYHQHKHLHEHEHKQEHLHKHDQEHSHSHNHGHKHESRHQHDQHSFNEHQHHGVHHHAHEGAHHHDHSGTHLHGHKGDHKHGHHHQQKHHHRGQHMHDHRHKGEHGHVHKSEHRNEHTHQTRSPNHQITKHHRGSSGSKGRTRGYEESIHKGKREQRRGYRRRPSRTNGTNH